MRGVRCDIRMLEARQKIVGCESGNGRLRLLDQEIVTPEDPLLPQPRFATLLTRAKIA